jgi:hypothetical protein
MDLNNVLSLRFLWDILNPVLGASLKPSIQPSLSSERGRAHIFTLYHTLGDLDATAARFFDSLQSLLCELMRLQALGVGRSDSAYTLQQITMDAGHNMERSLLRLGDSLRLIDPRLDIYQDETVRHIDRYLRSGGDIIYRSLLRLYYGDASDIYDRQRLTHLLDYAARYHGLLTDTISELRALIARELALKECQGSMKV